MLGSLPSAASFFFAGNMFAAKIRIVNLNTAVESFRASGLQQNGGDGFHFDGIANRGVVVKQVTPFWQEIYTMNGAVTGSNCFSKWVFIAIAPAR
ncbi:hypothetical protein dsmv_3703 [Desulfococcus multivorans DSM 2059]|uniref:Uncharacterized protein n=1 Tax=Desulfococcus multivorans DSM 2059 TaxID=1121405 RepID=S7U6R2_DESML|nr:hypothetical protein dsmv_3703 [Desulfococcus multivorans DSM 2059]SKA29507.1 hypothetical protein SAMN02745446_03852 [Desulfococcus multivorans DSM 2059]